MSKIKMGKIQMSSLRFKIIISTLLIIILIITGSYLIIHDVHKRIIEEDFRDKGYLLAIHVASEVSIPVLENDFTEARSSIKNTKNNDPEIEYIFVTDLEGRMLVHTFDNIIPKELQNITNPPHFRMEHVFYSEKGIVHEFDAPLLRDSGYVHVGLSENRVSAQINEASRELLAIGILAMFFGFVFIYFIGRRLTEPVQKLTEGARKMNKGILDQKIDINTNGELGELAQAFNDMAFSLDQKIRDLVASKEFNEEILNNVNLAIHVVDKDMKILAINDELVKLGRGKFKKEHLLNKNLYDAFPILKEKFADKEYEHVLKTGEIFLSEEKTEYYGEVVYTSTSKIPVKGKDGSVEKIITVMKDVSEQRKLEEELKDSYDELRLTYLKLKELYRLKDNFLSNMSHELRTPLTSILGYTELLLEEKITEEQRYKLEIILRNSKKLARSIEGLLDTTLIESRNLLLDRQMLSVYELTTQVVDTIKPMASIKNISIHIKIPQSLTVEGDRDRLMLVFSNIVDNAVKFTIKGEISIIADEENECVHIRVSDTGIGIPEDKLKLIFDRFYQLDSSNKYGGVGLGLWISKNIVEAHGGKIWAESKNIGSTFHVLLPKTVKG